MPVRAVRGATQVERDDRDEVLEATTELVREVLERNALDHADLISIVFTAVGTAFAFEGIMKVWSQRSFPTLLRTTAQGVIISVARFVAALVASITPVVLSAGPGILYGILAALAFVGCAWACPRRTASRASSSTSRPSPGPSPSVRARRSR